MLGERLTQALEWKNIVPNLLMAISNRSDGNRWSCASACSNVALRIPSASASERARSIIASEMSRPTAHPFAGEAGRIARGLPRPAADIQHPFFGTDLVGLPQRVVVHTKLGVIVDVLDVMLDVMATHETILIPRHPAR
jgi:hypothetical protein